MGSRPFTVENFTECGAGECRVAILTADISWLGKRGMEKMLKFFIDKITKLYEGSGNEDHIDMIKNMMKIITASKKEKNKTNSFKKIIESMPVNYRSSVCLGALDTVIKNTDLNFLEYIQKYITFEESFYNKAIAAGKTCMIDWAMAKKIPMDVPSMINSAILRDLRMVKYVHNIVGDFSEFKYIYACDDLSIIKWFLNNNIIEPNEMHTKACVEANPRVVKYLRKNYTITETLPDDMFKKYNAGCNLILSEYVELLGISVKDRELDLEIWESVSHNLIDVKFLVSQNFPLHELVFAYAALNSSIDVMDYLLETFPEKFEDFKGTIHRREAFNATVNKCFEKYGMCS